MRATVAVLAVGCLGHAGLSYGMQTVCISLLCVGMALGAGNLFGRGLMGQTLDILVAINAREHAAMNGLLHLAFIHHIRMAGKTVLIFELLLGKSREGVKK